MKLKYDYDVMVSHIMDKPIPPVSRCILILDELRREFGNENDGENDILSISEEDLRKYIEDHDYRNYADWIQRKYLIKSIFELMNYELDMSVYNEPEDLKNIKSLIYYDELLGYMENIKTLRNKFIFMACFFGLGHNKYKYLINLKIDNILDNKVLFEEDDKMIEFPVNETFVDMARELNDTYSEKFVDINMAIKSNRYDKNCEYVVKPILKKGNLTGDIKMSYISLNKIISSTSKNLVGDTSLNRTTLEKSGILHRMFQLENDEGIEWTSGLLQNVEYFPFNYGQTEILKQYELMYKKPHQK